jgi:stage II sporulation protein D (peptidoglycan lytic transglycosylase)
MTPPAFADETPIRVSVLRHQFQAVVSSEGGLIVRPPNATAGSPYVAPDVTTVLDVRPTPQGLLLAGIIQAGNTIVVSPAAGFPIAVDGLRYRGSVILQATNGESLDVVNVVDLEQYLYGVVASEMETTWPAAALEAQAIVARTYAVAHLGTREWLGYDLLAGEQDQAYKGMQVEMPSVRAAVDATRGTVLTYGADLVHAYYSSCDGGYTSRGDALSDPQPYLVSVPDAYCKQSPDERWTVDVPLDDFMPAFAARYGDIGSVVAVHAGEADSSGRLETVTILGTLDSRAIPATVFRSLAGNHVVRSTRIVSIGVVGLSIRVSGSGFGHGVGMAQWGARAMAEDGKTAEEILKFYYHGASYAQIADRLGQR